MTLDDDTADRLLAGAVNTDDAPPGFAGVATVLGLVAHRLPGPDDAVVASTVAAMAQVVTAEVVTAEVVTAEATVMRSVAGTVVPRRRLSAISLKLAAAAATGVISLSGVAAAAGGSLPGPVQRAVSGAASHVGVRLPDGSHGAGSLPPAHTVVVAPAAPHGPGAGATPAVHPAGDHHPGDRHPSDRHPSDRHPSGDAHPAGDGHSNGSSGRDLPGVGGRSRGAPVRPATPNERSPGSSRCGSGASDSVPGGGPCAGSVTDDRSAGAAPTISSSTTLTANEAGDGRGGTGTGEDRTLRSGARGTSSAAGSGGSGTSGGRR